MLFRDDCLDDDGPAAPAPGEPEPEAPAKCYECGRLSVNTDICIYCASPLMYSEAVSPRSR